MPHLSKLVIASLIFLVLWIGSATTARADTVNFTFTFDATIAGDPPIPPTSTVNSILTGTGFVTPFGAATDTEVGTTTFITWPPPPPGGVFGPISVAADFTFSFNGGANTIFGTDAVVFDPPGMAGFTNTHTYTILGGTGIFSGASGAAIATGFTPPPLPGQTPRETFNGSGTVTAPGLTAVPEPATMLLLGTGLAGVAMKVRNKRKANKSEEV